jgi:hypothetical protein
MAVSSKYWKAGIIACKTSPSNIPQKQYGRELSLRVNRRVRGKYITA